MKLNELLEAARSGDPHAREALARALYEFLWPRFRRSFSPAEAEDLVQSTMLLIFRRIDRDRDRDPPQAFERFVKLTARRVGLMARRSWAREHDRRVAEPHGMVALDTSLSERLDRQERVARIAAAVDELGTTDQRTVLGWAMGADWRALAEFESVARATLRTRVYRTLSKLRELVQRRAEGQPEPSST